MKTTLTIGTKTYDARPSALTEGIFRELFKKDLKIEMSSLRSGSNKDTSLFKELAFVMVWQARPRDKKIGEAIKDLSINDYYEWLDEIDESDFLKAETLTSITNTWLGNGTTTVSVKNLASPQ